MSETTGDGILRGKRSGKVSRTNGAESSRPDSEEWTVSFGYFRTPNGLPPGAVDEHDPIPEDPPRRRRRK